MIRSALAGLSIGVVAASGGAMACGPPAALAPPASGAAIVVDGVAATLRDQTLQVWPISTTAKLNSGFGLELVFTDRAGCVVKMTEAMAGGVTVAIGRGVVTALEVVVCDDDEGSCLPVRIVFPR